MCSLVKKYILYLKPKIHINIIYLVPGPCHICDGQLRCVHTSMLCTWQIRKYNHAYTYTQPTSTHKNTSFFMALPSMQCMTNVFSFVINVNEGCLKSFVIEACHSFSSLSDRQLLIKKSYFLYNIDYDTFCKLPKQKYIYESHSYPVVANGIFYFSTLYVLMNLRWY